MVPVEYLLPEKTTRQIDHKGGKKIDADAWPYALLRRWIEAGGKDEKHWAYIPPAKPEIPKESHPVDHLLKPQIESSGLTVNEEADRRTLIRRVSLDLTGLPPEPEESTGTTVPVLRWCSAYAGISLGPERF